MRADLPALRPEDLDEFFGSENFYRHWLGNMIYTDGVKYFAERAGNGAYWFLDIVATEIWEIHKKGEEFIAVNLTVPEQTERAAPGTIGAVLESKRPRYAARIIADDGNGKLLFSRDIEYTDCPPGTWKFYLENGTMCLPGER